MNPSDWQAVLLSLKVAGVASGLFLVPCVGLGVWLATSASAWRGVAQSIVQIPLVLPPVATGLCLLKLLVWLRAPIVFTWWAAALAAGVVAAPLLVRTVRAGVEAMDARLLVTAATLGASRWRRLRTITIPMSWRAIVGGLVLFWARAMGEFGAVMVVASNTPGRTQTVPLAIYSKLEAPEAASIWPLVGGAVALSVAAVALSEWLVRGAAAQHGPRT